MIGLLTGNCTVLWWVMDWLSHCNRCVWKGTWINHWINVNYAVRHNLYSSKFWKDIIIDFVQTIRNHYPWFIPEGKGMSFMYHAIKSFHCTRETGLKFDFLAWANYVLLLFGLMHSPLAIICWSEYLVCHLQLLVKWSLFWLTVQWGACLLSVLPSVQCHLRSCGVPSW